jgi:ribosomal protein S19E (S16A)
MSKPTLRQIVDQALADKTLTRAEQQEILEAVTEDKMVSPEEHAILDEIMEKITSGEIKVI